LRFVREGFVNRLDLGEMLLEGGKFGPDEVFQIAVGKLHEFKVFVLRFDTCGIVHIRIRPDARNSCAFLHRNTRTLWSRPGPDGAGRNRRVFCRMNGAPAISG
jgi:hypothetical protein